MAHVGKPTTTRKGTAYRVKWRDPNGAFRERAVYGKRDSRSRPKSRRTCRAAPTPTTGGAVRRSLRWPTSGWRG